MFLAIVLGVCAGAIGTLPMIFSLRLSRKFASTAVMRDALLWGLGGVAVSLIFVVLAMIICAFTARQFILFFGVAEVLSLIAVMSVFVIIANRNAKF